MDSLFIKKRMKIIQGQFDEIFSTLVMVFGYHQQHSNCLYSLFKQT